MWGIHNDVLGPDLVTGNFISIGWEGIGDLRQIGDDRDALKVLLQQTFPEAKAGAIPVWAGILLRFAFEMRPGDIVISPYKADSTLNFGVIDGPYEFIQSEPLHRHRRRVRWIRTGVPRGIFPQQALYEIGSAITLFRVRHNRSVFEQYLASASDDVTPVHTDPVTAEPTEEAVEGWAADEPSAARISQFTRDFVQKQLLAEMSHQQFEEFTADLLVSMGYQARVTPYTGDGGVDVIAHRDPLGLEPPIIKVQCKHTTATQSRPDVQRLIGTLASNELGLFVTLGTYSKDAVDLERERQNLRLLTGADIVELTMQHYQELPARWRQLMPLRQVFAVDRDAEGR
ncbi:restriction endonuclease [Yimella sp. cx-51]|uniref:restriction endonuclease n=1 Tax=Yimella sp. cx-51 TaxID=2770551 RepID=UPI00165DAF16|nr:restriction endonuclease [Yimella sp. cx-51]MBC9958376.1 restriction endonuclease [Yimella sp. cx-51]QTH39434.1 restriction endonuclease [Yimella sp. cx-51]